MHCSPSWLQACGRHCVSLLSIKDLAVAISTRVLKMTHHYINQGRNRSRLFVRERVELLIELSGRWLRTNIGIIAPPTCTLFQIVWVFHNQQHCTLNSAPAHYFFTTLKSYKAVQTGHWRTMASILKPISSLVRMHTCMGTNESWP